MNGIKIFNTIRIIILFVIFGLFFLISCVAKPSPTDLCGIWVGENGTITFINNANSVYFSSDSTNSTYRCTYLYSDLKTLTTQLNDNIVYSDFIYKTKYDSIFKRCSNLTYKPDFCIIGYNCPQDKLKSVREQINSNTDSFNTYDYFICVGIKFISKTEIDLYYIGETDDGKENVVHITYKKIVS